MLLPHTLRFSALATGTRLAKLAEALGERCDVDAVGQAIAAVEALLARLAVPRPLRELGVPQVALRSIAQHAMSHWFLQKNPRRVTGSGELEGVLRAAW